MPRNSPHAIQLSTDERRRMEAVAQEYTSPYCEVARAKVVLLAAEGFQNKEIGERLDLPRQIVSKWRKRFYKEGLTGPRGRPRWERPRFFPL